MNLPYKLLFGAIALSVVALRAGASEKTPSDYLASAWNRAFYQPYVSELARISHNSSDASANNCENFYSHVRRTGGMKILLGVGYYDFSEGTPFEFDYVPDGSIGTVHYNFGDNSTLDQTFIKVYTALLTAPCRGELQFCGFDQESPGVFSKMIRTPEGARVKAVLEMRSPSVSTSHAENVGPLKSEQDEKSADVTSWFFGGIPNADFVVYNGHARKGGGPDFNPPLLLSNKHPNYAWYGKHTPGLNRLITALKSSEEKPAAVMLMACNSTKLFEKQVDSVAPHTAFSGMDVVPQTGLIPVKGTIAGIDSYLKFQCQAGLNQEFSVDQDMREQLKPLTIKQ